MHDEIRKFQLEGELAETNLTVTKQRMVDHLESLMRDYGYVPSIDNDPQFTLNHKQQGTFDFSLTVYGVYVGKDRAWQVSGVAGGKTVPKFTVLTK